MDFGHVGTASFLPSVRNASDAAFVHACHHVFVMNIHIRIMEQLFEKKIRGIRGKNAEKGNAVRILVPSLSAFVWQGNMRTGAIFGRCRPFVCSPDGSRQLLVEAIYFLDEYPSHMGKF